MQLGCSLLSLSHVGSAIHKLAQGCEFNLQSPTMTTKYQPKHVQQLFSKSSETIRTWSVDFSAFLSLDANPTSGHRRYTDDDLRVLALVNYRKADGASNETISAELANGQRAEPPREASAIVAADERSELLMLQIQLETAQETMTQLRDQIAKSNTRADRAEGQNELLLRLLKDQLADKDAEIARLNRLLGQGG